MSIKEYLSIKGEEFISKYEIALNYYVINFQNENENVEGDISPLDIEEKFLKSIIDYDVENTVLDEFQFYSLLTRIDRMGRSWHLDELLKNKKSTIKNNLLVEGKQLNISERYSIANKVFDIYNTLNYKNISASQKHIILAHVLGCSEQVARELFNGTQQKRTPVRDELIDSFFKNI